MKYLLGNPHGRTWLFLRSYILKAALVSLSIAATTTPRDIGPNEVEWGLSCTSGDASLRAFSRPGIK